MPMNGSTRTLTAVSIGAPPAPLAIDNDALARASGGTPSDGVAAGSAEPLAVGSTGERLSSGSREALARGVIAANRAVSSICVSRLVVLHSLNYVGDTHVHGIQ